jgi:hypothetical protein
MRVLALAPVVLAAAGCGGRTRYESTWKDSVPQDRLLWSGKSVTTNPAKVDAFVKELSAKAAEEK